jgi:HEAT repeat protein
MRPTSDWFQVYSMKLASVVLSIILAATGVSHSRQQTSKGKRTVVSNPSSEERRAWNDLKDRFTKYSNFLSGNIWALIHTYRSKAEMERSLHLFEAIAIALASDDPASLKKFGGPNGFKSQLVRLMKSRDDTVSGFAAIVLAITGDMNYAPAIAMLLNRNSHQPPDKYPPITVRGRAAVALGLLGAKQYTEQIAALLKSRNDYDRSGATTAIGYLKATEHAQDVVNLLLSNDPEFRDDDSPIYCLFEMGIAANYKKEIAQVLSQETRWETSKTAAFALAHLGAREYARDIARRLDSLGKGDMAKALAIMGAREYAGKIAPMLDDKSPFNQRDAALALGILEAKEYAPNIARLLKAEDSWTRYVASLSLVLMEADAYGEEAIHEIEETHKAGAYFDEGDFHVLVKEEAVQLDARFRLLLARMKAKLPKPPSNRP